MVSGLNNSRERVLAIIKAKGPLLPAKVAKEINTNILFASAILAELVSTKMVKITHLKVGGSPLYYVLGQQYKFADYRDKLNEKDRKTFDILKEQKILRDSEVSPLMRVSLRNIRDFAIPLEVTLDNTIDIFWKWHLLSNEDAESLIKKQVFPEEKEKEKSKEENVEISNVEEKTIGSSLSEDENTMPEKAKAEHEKKKQEHIQRTLVNKEKEEFKKEIESGEPDSAAWPEPRFRQKSKQIKQEFPEIQDLFFTRVRKYFDENDISIAEINIIKRNTDIEFGVKVPTAIGRLDFYCRAKNKKKPNDNDLASAYVQGEVKKLPVLFLSTGELTKKAREMLDREFKRIKVAKI